MVLTDKIARLMIKEAIKYWLLSNGLRIVIRLVLHEVSVNQLANCKW